MAPRRKRFLEEYPAIGSLAKVYGAITFLLEHPGQVEEYIGQQEALWEQLERECPLPPEMVSRFEQAGKASRRKSA